jgi:hypothetical protein
MDGRRLGLMKDPHHITWLLDLRGSNATLEPHENFDRFADFGSSVFWG